MSKSPYGAHLLCTGGMAGVPRAHADLRLQQLERRLSVQLRKAPGDCGAHGVDFGQVEALAIHPKFHFSPWLLGAFSVPLFCLPGEGY